MDDREFRRLLEYFGFSWSGYRKVRKGVKKRVNRHMNQLGCRDMAAYLTELNGNQDIRQACEVLMTVSISRFFRDRGVWRTLKTTLLPELIARHPEIVKVWSAGCAGGEEVYSFKIVWECLQKRGVKLPGLQLLATDLNPACLDRARAGSYSLSSLKEVPKELLLLYFDRKKDGKHYTVKSFLAKDVVWETHHLLSDPPGTDFDIIFLRNNALTYYTNHIKKKIFSDVLKSLTTTGIFIIGSHEALPFETSEVVPVAAQPLVYRKR